MWATHASSSRAHAVREEAARIQEPSVRMSMCGRVAWYSTAPEAPLEQVRCASCLRILGVAL